MTLTLTAAAVAIGAAGASVVVGSRSGTAAATGRGVLASGACAAVALPGYGPLVTMTDMPRHVARGGLHEVDENTIYVSAGVRLERAEAPQVRLFSRPSIGILTLRDQSA